MFRWRTFSSVCLLSLALASCTGKPPPDPADPAALRQGSTPIGGPDRWDSWGGDRMLKHHQPIGPANLASLAHTTASFGLGTDSYGSPIVLQQQGGDYDDEIYVVGADSDLNKFGWQNGNLVKLWEQGNAIGGPNPQTATTPSYGINDVLYWIAPYGSGYTQLLRYNLVTQSLLTPQLFAGAPTYHGCAQACMPHVSQDFVYFPTSEGVYSWSASDNRINDLWSASKNVLVGGGYMNPLNLSPDWCAHYDRGGSDPLREPVEIDCWWPWFDGPGNAIDWRYTTRGQPGGAPLLTGHAPGPGWNASQGSLSMLWETSSWGWIGHCVTTTSDGVFYLRPDPTQDPQQLPRRLVIKRQAKFLPTQPVISPPATRMLYPAPGNYQVYFVRDVSGIQGSGTLGVLDVYSVSVDFSSDTTIYSMTQVYESAPFANPSIYAPCVDDATGTAWVSGTGAIYAFQLGNPNPVYTAPVLGQLRGQPVLGGHRDEVQQGERVYYLSSVNGVATLHSIYTP